MRIRNANRRWDVFCFGAMVLLAVAATNTADAAEKAYVLTASNADKNELLVYNSTGDWVESVATQGKGGVSGNAGGIAAYDSLVAVVNFGSESVSLFRRHDDHFELKQSIPALSSPVSVAFGHDHLYILGTTTVESHQVSGLSVEPYADGAVNLLIADGSAAQVGVVENKLIVTEKSNMIETVPLSGGALGGVAKAVENIPANVNAPFGLVTRGDDAYVTIAHANEISLVRGGDVLTVTGSHTQHAPCWLTLRGPFLFSSNSPSMTVSRYAVYGRKIVQDAAVAATLNGNPTDIASENGLIAVIDGDGSVSHLSIFQVDEDGNMTAIKVNTIKSAANGVVILP